MAARQWMIVEGINWRIARVNGVNVEFFGLPADENEPSLGSRLARCLRAHGHRGEQVVLGVASSRCLTGLLQREEAANSVDRQTQVYQFEEQLPINAEQMAVDFLDSSGRDLGVAVAVDELLPLLENLEEQGVPVVSVTPWALVACRQYIESPNTWDRIYWCSDQRTDAFTFDSGHLVGWANIDSTPESVRQHGHLCDADASADRILILDADPESELASTAEALGAEVRSPILLDEYAALGARQIAAGRRTAWIELRRDALANARPLRSLWSLMRVTAGTTALMLVVLIGCLLTRAVAYERLAEQSAERQREVFRQTMPDQRVPPAIASRLRSELNRLRAERQSENSEAASTSIMPMVLQFLRAAPADLRFKLTHLNFSGRRLDVSGEVQSLGDAASIADELTAGGFDVSSPQTVRSGEGYSFGLAANFDESASMGESDE